MRIALWRWIADRVSGSTGSGGRVLFPEVVDKFEQKRRCPNPITEHFEELGVETLKTSWSADRDILPFVDYLIAIEGEGRWESQAITDLEEILLECGSAWKVGTREGHVGLERRVPLGVQEAADHVMATSGRAGERLSGAWHATFGVSPDPSKAYSLAVKAVEDAAIGGTVPPNQPSPTLGNVIRQLEKDGDWNLPLTREDPKAPTSETVVRMLRALWRGHHDRHGGDPGAPQSVSQDEAEAAVMLAVPLVQWFTSGAVRRPTPEGPASS
ncbi:hypothetical protein [Promicromonospora soli]